MEIIKKYKRHRLTQRDVDYLIQLRKNYPIDIHVYHSNGHTTIRHPDSWHGILSPLNHGDRTMQNWLKRPRTLLAVETPYTIELLFNIENEEIVSKNYEYAEVNPLFYTFKEDLVNKLIMGCLI